MKKGHREVDTVMNVRSTEKARNFCLLELKAKKIRKPSYC